MQIYIYIYIIYEGVYIWLHAHFKDFCMNHTEWRHENTKSNNSTAINSHLRLLLSIAIICVRQYTNPAHPQRMYIIIESVTTYKLQEPPNLAVKFLESVVFYK